MFAGDDHQRMDTGLQLSDVDRAMERRR